MLSSSSNRAVAWRLISDSMYVCLWIADNLNDNCTTNNNDDDESLKFQDNDSDSERSDRIVSSLVAGPSLLQYEADGVVTDEDADEDDDDDYGEWGQLIDLLS